MYHTYEDTTNIVLITSPLSDEIVEMTFRDGNIVE